MMSERPLSHDGMMLLLLGALSRQGGQMTVSHDELYQLGNDFAVAVVLHEDPQRFVVTMVRKEVAMEFEKNYATE